VEHHRVAAIRIDQPVLAAATEGGDSRTRQALPKAGGKGATQIRSAQLNAPELAPEKHLFEPADRRFNFGEFWHRSDMANVGAGS
jgi:hypothetical protein